MSPKQRIRARISPTRVRYIKLGEGGAWADQCIREGTLRIGFGTEKCIELCQAGRWKELAAAYTVDELAKSTVTRFTGEVQIVYEDDGTVPWITFHNLRLYWAHIDPSVPAWIAPDGDGTVRKTQSGWSCRTIDGEELFMVNWT